MIAIIPAAGLGTRMAEVTSGAPKELLEVGGVPILQRVVEEMLLAPVERVRIVGSPAKPLLQDFVLNLGNTRIEYALQDEPLGVADAVRSGAEPHQSALIAMADTIYLKGSPVPELAQALEDGAWAALAVHEVPEEELGLYGVVGFSPEGWVDRVIEKPSIAEAPSRWAVASRFAMSADASDALFEMMGRRIVEGLTLTDVLEEGIKAGKRVEAVRLPAWAEIYDCGTPKGYLEAARAHGG